MAALIEPPPSFRGHTRVRSLPICIYDLGFPYRKIRSAPAPNKPLLTSCIRLGDLMEASRSCEDLQGLSENRENSRLAKLHFWVRFDLHIFSSQLSAKFNHEPDFDCPKSIACHSKLKVLHSQRF